VKYVQAEERRRAMPSLFESETHDAEAVEA
jgi:hypothetical protein